MTSFAPATAPIETSSIANFSDPSVFKTGQSSRRPLNKTLPYFSVPATAGDCNHVLDTLNEALSIVQEIKIEETKTVSPREAYRSELLLDNMDNLNSMLHAYRSGNLQLDDLSIDSDFESDDELSDDEEE